MIKNGREGDPRRARAAMSQHREVRSLGVVAASPAGFGNASWTCREILDFRSLLEFSRPMDVRLYWYFSSVDLTKCSLHFLFIRTQGADSSVGCSCTQHFSLCILYLTERDEGIE